MKKQVSKCLLVYRGIKGKNRDIFTDFVPMGLFNILKALLNQGINAYLINLSKYKDKDVEKFIKDSDYHIVFISSFFGNHNVSFEIANLFKKYHKKTYTVLGGPIFTIGKEILKRYENIDFIIKGEGEESSISLLEELNGNKNFSNVYNLIYRKSGQIIENPVKLIEDIDKYFFLPSEILPYCKEVEEENFSILITSRGCPFNCSFCSSPAIWQRKVRFHSINLLIAYLKDLRKNFGSLYFSIRDDNFLSNKKRVKYFAQLIVKEKLHFLWNTQGSSKFIDEEISNVLSKAGCDQVQMGIESAVPRLLSFLNKNINVEEVKEAIKNLRKNLIRPFGYFICGMKETYREIMTTLNFIKTSGIIDAVIAPLAVYPGTALSKKYSMETFFQGNEIIYYDLNSFKKYYKYFLDTFADIYQIGFTSSELNEKRDYNFKDNIVKYYAYKENEKKSLSYLTEIITREPDNPWGFYLLGKHFYKKNQIYSLKYLDKAGILLNGKNKEINNLLKKLNK